MQDGFVRRVVTLFFLSLVACSGRDPAPPTPTVVDEPPPPLPGEIEVAHHALEEQELDLAALPAPVARSAPVGDLTLLPSAEPELSIPEGWRLQAIASDLGPIDHIAAGPEGGLFVIDREGNEVTRLVDGDRDGLLETHQLFADGDNGLDRPSAIVFTPGAAFIAQRGAVIRHAWPRGQERLQGDGGRVATFPALDRGSSLLLMPDRRHLLVGIGSGARRARPDALEGTVMEINFSGSQRREWARGLFWPLGLALDEGGAPLALVRERGDLGPHAVPDMVARLPEGSDLGWPTHFLGDRPDPHGRSVEPPSVWAPDAVLPPSGRATALVYAPRFGDLGPGVFVSLAGSAVHPPRVVHVTLTAAPTRSHRVVMDGFGGSDGQAAGRPTAVAMQAGALLVADGGRGDLYRLSVSD